jgi:hypothetical protein
VIDNVVDACRRRCVVNRIARWWPDVLVVIGVTWLSFACSAYAGDGTIEGQLDQGGGDVVGDFSIAYTQSERVSIATATALTTIGVLGKINQRRAVSLP